MKPLEIFKPGKHTALNGLVIEFSDADLRASAKAYDPAKHEAPLVVGHPKTDDPAYGWVNALDYAGSLQAMPHQVDAQFVEMVNAGRFKKISASFFLPDAPNNPVPGVYYLRHVGFLGAQPPAVKGLKSASFGDGGEGVVEFADIGPLSGWRVKSLATILRGLREWIISKNTIEEADRVIPTYLVDDIESAPEGNAVGAAYSEPSKENQDMMTKEELAAQEAKIKADREELDRKNAEFADRDKALKAAEAKTRRAAIAEFVAGLVRDGKLLPRDQAGLVAYMAGPNDAGVIEFAEGEEKKTAKADDWLRGFLSALPKQVDYVERSSGTGNERHSVSFAAPAGYSVDPARLELHNKALAYQAEHPNTTYEAAIAAVNR